MDTKEIRRQARAHLQGNWGLSIGVAVVACLLGGLLTGMSFIPEISYWKQLNFFHDRDLSQYVSGSWEIVQGVRIEFKNGIFGLASFLWFLQSHTPCCQSVARWVRRPRGCLRV